MPEKGFSGKKVVIFYSVPEGDFFFVDGPPISTGQMLCRPSSASHPSSALCLNPSITLMLVSHRNNRRSTPASSGGVSVPRFVMSHNPNCCANTSLRKYGGYCLRLCPSLVLVPTRVEAFLCGSTYELGHEGNHEVEKTNGLDEGETQNSVREKLATKSGVAGNTVQESGEDETDTDTSTSQTDGGGTHTQVLGDLNQGVGHLRAVGAGLLLEGRAGGGVDDLGGLLALGGLEGSRGAYDAIESANITGQQNSDAIGIALQVIVVWIIDARGSWCCLCMDAENFSTYW